MRIQGKLKRLIKLSISIVFFCGFGLVDLVRRLLGKKAAGTCVVLYYHGISSEQRARFARQLDTIQRVAKPASIEAPPPPNTGARYVAVTFDDGFESVLENAIPELQLRGIPSTIFIPTELLGKFPPWLDTVADRKAYGRLVSADELKRLPSTLVTIGSHGGTHPLFPSLNEQAARQELYESRVKLEELTNMRVTLFSFPYGAFNEDLVKWCQEAGYERVFTSSPVIAFSDPNEFVTGRVWAEPTDWPLEFRLKILGAYRWLPLAFRLKRKVLSGRSRKVVLGLPGGAQEGVR
jgi:peptidoglycan/xylan/chitin deacetylase (PgdA/CDA1 family)